MAGKGVPDDGGNQAHGNNFNGPAPFQVGAHGTQNNFIYQEGEAIQAEMVKVEFAIKEEWDLLRTLKREEHPWYWGVMVQNASRRPIFNIEVTFGGGGMQIALHKIWKMGDRRSTEETIWGPDYPQFGGVRAVSALGVNWCLWATTNLARPLPSRPKLRAHPPEVSFSDDDGARWKIDRYGALRSCE
jgi:hypothetical protein